MVAVMSHIAEAVQRPMANAPMMRLLRVIRTSGTRANGIPKLSITWLRTRMRVGLSPQASTARAGTTVMPRRRNTLPRRPRKPSMMAWPANVPTLMSQQGKQQETVNYEVRGQYYVADRLLPSAVLTFGTGANRQTVQIVSSR